MRSIRLLTATTVILAGAWACGGDGGGDTGENQDPSAAFTAPACTAATDCTFTDASSDPQGAATITTRVWNFGDGTADVTAVGTTQIHRFETPGDYQVKLTVTDDAGNTDDVTNTVTVAGPTNPPPTAAFTVPACTVGVSCLFSDLSSPRVGGSIATWAWNFGDNTTPPEQSQQNPSHTYTTPGIYQVTLTVTDDLGATGTTTQSVTVSELAATNCTTTGNSATCTLNIEQQSTVLVTLVSRACQLVGNNVRVDQPNGQFVFNNACRGPAPGPYGILDKDTGLPAVFPAGTQLRIIFIQGQVTDPATDPPVGPPAARLSGSSTAGWIINIDDGGNTGAPGEPDFDDLVLQVQATPAS
jgi:PKD repeat protein